jgi:hypothetical protein
VRENRTHGSRWRGEAPGGQSASPRGSLTPPPDPVRVYTFSVTEHDPERPWIVLGTGRHSVELEDGAEFFAWAAERWPRERFTVQLDSYCLLDDVSCLRELILEVRQPSRRSNSLENRHCAPGFNGPQPKLKPGGEPAWHALPLRVARSEELFRYPKH